MSRSVALINKGGAHLPVEAWVTAYDQFGDSVLTGATYIPPEVASTLLDRPKVPAAVAKAIVTHSEGEAITRLASDTRPSVRTALLSTWELAGPAVDALLCEKLSAEQLSELRMTPMTVSQRAALWSQMGYSEAFADALRHIDMVAADEVADTLCRTAYEMYDSTHPENVVTAFAHRHPQLVTAVIERGSLLACQGVAALRLTPEEIAALIERRPERGMDARSTFAETMCRVADHPGTPLELRDEAIAALDGLGCDTHLELPVLVELVPHVPSPEDWTDEAALVALSRHFESWKAPQRVLHLLEILACDNVSDRYRSVAARMLVRVGRGPTGWEHILLDAREHVAVYTPTKERHWADQLREKLAKRKPTELASATEPVRREYLRAPTWPNTAKVSELTPSRFVLDGEHRCAAAFLAEKLAPVPTTWPLVWELYDGFPGTISEFADVVLAST